MKRHANAQIMLMKGKGTIVRAGH